MSETIRTIVLGYDGFARQEPLPEAALGLAREHGAKLVVVNVAPEVPATMRKVEGVDVSELQQALVELRRARLEALLEPLRSTGMEAEGQVQVGWPHVELIRQAHKLQASLLVVSDEPLNQDGKRGFGSVTRKLLRECPCPVMAVRTVRPLQTRRVVAAVDLEASETESGRHLGQAIIETAGTVAQHAKCDLVIFHAWTLWGEDLLRSRTTKEAVDAMVEQVRDSHAERLNQLVGSCRLGSLQPQIRIQKGEARHILPRDLNDECDMLVLGTVSRSGLPGVIIGNTAERLVNQLSCPILAIKPAGFETPVDLGDG